MYRAHREPVMTEAEPYSGLFGAYPYAFRQSDSWLFRGYVAVSALVGVYVGLLLVLSALSWVASPGLLGEKALLGVIGILVFVPLFAPVLIVARRHRLGLERVGADRALGLSGFAFLAAVVLALLISDPSDHGGAGAVGAVFSVLDGLPATYGLVPPVVAALAIYLAVRHTRPDSGSAGEG